MDERRIRFGVALREATLAADRREVEVVCIRPGLSRNGNFYGPECLAEAVGLFEGAHAYVDHADTAVRSVRDLAGVYRGARIGAEGEVRATLRVARAQEWLWALIAESVGEGSDLVGLSIDVSAAVREGEVRGQRCRIVERISALHSVDVITRASAGGGFARVVREADNGSWWDQCAPQNEEAAALAERSRRSGMPAAAQQVAVVAGQVAPVQVGPTIAQGIAGGQLQLGGTYVSEQLGLDAALVRRELEHCALYAAPEPSEEAPRHGWQGIDAGGVPHGEAVRDVPGQGGLHGIGGQMTMEQESAMRAVAGQGGSTVVREAASREGTAVGPVAIMSGVGGASGAGMRDEATALLEDLRRQRALLEAERLLDRRLREGELPAPSATRLRLRLLESGTVPDGAAIDAAIGEERAFLAELAALDGAGLIRGQGYERAARVTMTEGDRLQRAFDQLFDPQEGGAAVPRLSGIREAYVAATGDALLSGVSDPARLREADTTTASFSYLLGTSMNKRLLKDYQAWPSEWQKFCTIAPIRDFKQQDRIRLGAFGSLSTVAEDAAYTTISLSDTRATYTPAKRGNLVAVTRETIVNDDMYAIKQIPGKLAVSAAFTLAEFVYTLLAANGAVIYDTFKLFDSINHANTGVVGANLGTPGSGASLSSAALQAAVAKMRRQTNLASKPIGLKRRYLVVPPELEWQAMVVTKSAGAPGNNYNDINPMLGYCEVLVAPQLASPGYWLAVADPRVIDTIELGFVGGQMNPQLFIQDQPLFGNNFTNDVITYKVRHEYGGAVVDYRGFYLGNN